MLAGATWTRRTFPFHIRFLFCFIHLIFLFGSLQDEMQVHRPSLQPWQRLVLTQRHTTLLGQFTLNKKRCGIFEGADCRTRPVDFRRAKKRLLIQGPGKPQGTNQSSSSSASRDFVNALISSTNVEKCSLDKPIWRNRRSTFVSSVTSFGLVISFPRSTTSPSSLRS